MKRVRIFRHVVCEGPGYLGEFLDREGVPWELVCLDEGNPVPGDLDRVSGLVFMGGNMSVNDPLDWIAEEMKLIRLAQAANLPMMGICFGGQLISKALGGEVVPGLNGMEIGWFPLKRVPDERCEGWLAGLPESVDMFHWHGETFLPPPGSRQLLESLCFRNQAFVIGNSLAMQFHLEMTEEMVRGWLKQYGGDLHKKSACAQCAAEITENIGEKVDRLHRVADAVYGNWLERLKRHHGY